MKRKIGTNNYITHNYSTERTASASVVTGPGILYGIELRTDGSTDVTLNIFDSLSAAGTKLITSDIVVKGSSNLVMIEINRPYTTGVYVSVVTSGSCAYILEYDN